jgi:hypothetical protein
MQFEFLNNVRLSKYSRVLGTSFIVAQEQLINNKNKQLLKLFAENRLFYLKSGCVLYIDQIQYISTDFALNPKSYIQEGV